MTNSFEIRDKSAPMPEQQPCANPKNGLEASSSRFGLPSLQHLQLTVQIEPLGFDKPSIGRRRSRRSSRTLR